MTSNVPAASGACIDAKSNEALLMGCCRAGADLRLEPFRYRGTKYLAVCDIDRKFAQAISEELGIPEAYSFLEEAQRLRSVQNEIKSKAVVAHSHKFMARISRNWKSQVMDIDPPDVLIDRDVVQHQPDTIDFLKKLTSLPSEATFTRLRTRDQWKTIFNPDQ